MWQGNRRRGSTIATVAQSVSRRETRGRPSSLGAGGRGLFVRLRSVSGFRHTRRRRQSSGASPRQAQAPGPDADHSTGVGRGWGEPARPSPNRDAVLVAVLRLGPARSGPQGSAVPADHPGHRFGSPWSGLGPGRAGSGWFAPPAFRAGGAATNLSLGTRRLTTDKYAAPQRTPPKEASQPPAPFPSGSAGSGRERAPDAPELVCRQLDMEASRVRPAWDLALRIQPVEPVAIDPHT